MTQIVESDNGLEILPGLGYNLFWRRLLVRFNFKQQPKDGKSDVMVINATYNSMLAALSEVRYCRYTLCCKPFAIKHD